MSLSSSMYNFYQASARNETTTIATTTTTITLSTFREKLLLIAFDEGERILILPWAQAGCQIDLRDFRPGDRLAASTSCATVSDMVTKLCFSCSMMYNFALVSMSWTLPTSNSVSSSTLNCVQQTTKSVHCLCKPVRLWRIVADFFKSEHRVFCKNC